VTFASMRATLASLLGSACLHSQNKIIKMLAAVSMTTSVQGFTIGAAPLKAATPQMTRVVDSPVMM
jgi:hypothetical protein